MKSEIDVTKSNVIRSSLFMEYISASRIYN